jgi:hypothetical protein
MGRFSGWGEWVPAKEPAQVEVELDTGEIWAIEYREDYVYHEGWLSMQGFGELMSHTALSDAHDRAQGIRTRGVRMHGTHYPVHRIKEVRVVECNWVEKEHETVVKSWEIEPK